MLRSRAFRNVAIAMSAAVGLSCGDVGNPIGPVPAGYTQYTPSRTLVSSFVLLSSDYQAEAVQWMRPRRNDHSVTALIGPEGGSLKLPSSDFAMLVPEGALEAPTVITVTSRAGAHVVYDMEPHGLQFSKPVTAVQQLRHIASYGTTRAASVRSAYLSEENATIGADGSVTPAELQAAVTLFYGAAPLAETHIWTLNHFSRYILISGVWVLING